MVIVGAPHRDLRLVADVSLYAALVMVCATRQRPFPAVAAAVAFSCSDAKQQNSHRPSIGESGLRRQGSIGRPRMVPRRRRSMRGVSLV